MAKNSKIEWTDHTFNPWVGCTKVSPGCANCYAEARDQRFTGGKHWGKGAPRRRTSAANWKQPIKWDREARRKEVTAPIVMVGGGDGNTQVSTEKVIPQRPRVFCASLADWLDDEVPIEWLADLLKIIHDTPNLDWLLLTKRPQNWLKRMVRVADVLEPRVCDSFLKGWLLQADIPPFVPHNVWIGTTVEDQQRADERIPALLKIPARVRFLSCEPLLSTLNLQLSTDIHWVICGGESGTGARPMHPDWARSLRDQCQAAGVGFFFKQWGEWIAGDHVEELPDHEPKRICKLAMDGTQGNSLSLSYKQDQSAKTVCLVTKKIAGRVLDGREWNEVPA